MHTEAVSTSLIRLLKNLFQDDRLADLALVGGTNLALRFGHRESIDIDLFGMHTLTQNDISSLLKPMGEVFYHGGSHSIQVYTVDGIKVDFVRYPYEWIEEHTTIEGITFASVPDIAAMKIAAITQRGSRKDFIDLYLLLQHYTAQELLDFYTSKISDGNLWLALKSLTYFTDADKGLSPEVFLPVDWATMKSKILEHFRPFV
jgi:hypothetical protein